MTGLGPPRSYTPCAPSATLTQPYLPVSGALHRTTISGTLIPSQRHVVDSKPAPDQIEVYASIERSTTRRVWLAASRSVAANHDLRRKLCRTLSTINRRYS